MKRDNMFLEVIRFIVRMPIIIFFGLFLILFIGPMSLIEWSMQGYCTEWDSQWEFFKDVVKGGL